jgi:hypothetical protein
MRGWVRVYKERLLLMEVSGWEMNNFYVGEGVEK